LGSHRGRKGQDYNERENNLYTKVKAESKGKRRGLARDQEPHPNGSRTSLEEHKARLLTNPETGAEDYLYFQARSVRAFGPATGIFLRQAVFWAGRSTKLRDGWFYKSREAWRTETGLSHRQSEKARDILKDKGILEEHRVSRRSAMRYRVNLKALSAALSERE
jgi:hypothetical protein